MLEAKRKRLSQEQESMDADLVRTHPSSPTLSLSEGMHCSSQSPHPSTKRACVDLDAGNARVLKKEEDSVPVNNSTHVPNEVSKLFDPPATVKRPPARYVDFGAADLMSNDIGGFDQEGQDDKEEEMIRRDDTSRHKGDEITEEAIDGPQHDD